MGSYLGVLRHPNFRFLFLGQSASAVGDQAVIVALALYVTQRTGSASDLGLILAAQSLPLVTLILFGGVWADRLPRHRIMIACDLTRAALHGVLAALILTGGASVAEMVVIEILFGAARAFFQPAYTGLLPQTIPDALNQQARALSESTANLAVLLGPALGTALVLGVGAGVAFAFDAATFLVSAALLAPVRPRARGPAPVGAGASVWADLRDGWREVSSRPWVWVTIAAFTGAVLFTYAQWYALAPVIARDVYGGAGIFGVLETVIGARAVIGAVVALRWRPRRPMLVGLVLMLPWPLQAIAFALGAPLAGVIVIVLVAGFGFALFGIWWETALAAHISPAALSRVSAYDWMGSLALLPLGFALAGPLAAVVGARTVLGVGAAASLLLLAAALLPRSTRELGGGWSAEHLDRDVAEEGAREAEVAHVDPLVGVVHKGGGLE